MDVPVGDERFDRYYRRMRLALRLMLHGARAQIVSELSGFTQDQLATLKRRWLPGVEEGYRGPSPTSFAQFFRSAAKASHAALFAALQRMVGLHSMEPCLEVGERLCDTYEIYREWEPRGKLEFGYALLLATGTIKAEEVELTTCPECGRAMLLDKRGAANRTCTRCRGG